MTDFFTAGYRNQGFATLLTVVSLVFALGAVVYVATGRSGPLQMGIVIALSLFVLLRLARAGAFVDADGVRVVNPLRTVRVPWEEVAGFSLGPSGGFAAVGFVDRLDGSRVQVWGIQARNTTPAARRAPDAAIAALRDHLQDERRRRAGA